MSSPSAIDLSSSQPSSMTQSSESPFVDAASFSAPEPAIQESDSPMLYRFESPFRSAYRLTDEELIDPETAEFEAFVSELYDSEFNESMLELAHEAAEFVDDHLSHELSGSLTSPGQAESVLKKHYAPLINEVEQLFEAIAAEAGKYDDLALMTDSEVEAVVDQYTPGPGVMPPEFENFFGKIKRWAKKKAKKLIKKGVALAKKGLKYAGRLALKKLKKMAKPLFEWILKFAISKVPPKYRPMAQKLAKQLKGGLLKEIEEEHGGDGVERIQHEFDFQVANLLFAAEEAEQEAMVAEFSAAAAEPVVNPIGELGLAREQFIREINGLGENEDPGPQVERFLPALLPAIKLGIRLIGRPKVVKFLAKYAARLIKRFVGKKNASLLAPMIVDAGLKVLTLEATPEDETQAAGSAVAATVEEMVQRVAALPDYVLDDQELFEGFALQAFEHAAAANLPQVLPQKVYRTRPDLRESSTLNGMWLYQPLRGSKQYKKYTRIFDVSLSPYAAQTIKTFGRIPLAVYLRDRLGIPLGSTIKGRAHLYECIPGTSGTWVNRIGRFEKHVPGLGGRFSTHPPQFHPLTPEAAGLLLGHTHLGRKMAADCPHGLHQVTEGQRVYYLEIPGARYQMLPAGGSASLPRLASQIRAEMDFPREQIRLFVFLSEAESQEIASFVRRGAPLGAAMVRIHPLLREDLRTVFLGQRADAITFVHPVLLPARSAGAVLKRLPRNVLEMLAGKMEAWAVSALGEALRERGSEFVDATEDLADGVTAVVTLQNPPGLPTIRKALGGEPVSLAANWFPDGRPESRVQFRPGGSRG